MVQFQKATKEQVRLRMTIDGPAGSGKTYTALVFATELAKAENSRIAYIDTERGSAKKYADLFDFDVIELSSFHPDRYIECIVAAETAGYKVLVIDSLSHAWVGEDGVLKQHERATVKYQGNSWSAWRDASPLHDKLVNSILRSGCHVISTMRSKMEYIQTEERSKTVIKRVGMAPVQREGMEYEFDIIADMDIDHNMIISKTRCKHITGDVVAMPDGKWFQQVIAWLKDGAAPEPSQQVRKADNVVEQIAHTEPQPHWIDDPKTRAAFWARANELGLTDKNVYAALGVDHIHDFVGTIQDAGTRIKAWIAAQETKAVTA